MSTSKPSRLASPIAERRLTVVGEPDREIIIRVGKPRRDPDPSGDWMCPYVVEGLPGARRRYAHGIDSLQALQMAIEAARAAIIESGLACRYAGGEAGDIGIPRTIPVFGGAGRDFAPRMERSLDRELKRLATKVKKRTPRRGPG
ncbi:MAG: hypothetical protein QM820_35630 [Minicystis sp.]